MKLCSVCDNRIEGKWCKHCHRFVKTYESHASVYEPGERQSNVRMLQEMPQRNTEKNLTGKAAKRAAQKAAKGALAGGVSLVALLVCMGPYLPDIIDGVKVVSETMKAEKEANQRYFEEEVLISEEERQFYLNRMNRNMKIHELTPAESVIEREYRVFYFHPEDIKRFGYACDCLHFELSIADFEQWLSENWTDTYRTEEDSSVYSNLRSIEGETESYRFATYRYYRTEGEFYVQADFDTATEQLHEVYFETTETVPDAKLCHEMIKKFDPLTRLTEDAFADALREAGSSEAEYTQLYVSECVRVNFIRSNVGCAVVFGPVEREW